jgi:hypothetical protein
MVTFTAQLSLRALHENRELKIVHDCSEDVHPRDIFVDTGPKDGVYSVYLKTIVI